MDFSRTATMEETDGGTTKPVGARKRKPVNISKIPHPIAAAPRPHTRTPSYDEHEDDDAEEDYYDNDPPRSRASTSTPPDEPNNNKIQSILSELKFAKQRNSPSNNHQPRRASVTQQRHVRASIQSASPSPPPHHHHVKPHHHRSSFSPVQHRLAGAIQRSTPVRTTLFGGGGVVEENKSPHSVDDAPHRMLTSAHQQPRLTSIPPQFTTASAPSFQDEPLDLSVDAVDLRKNHEQQQNLVRMMMMMSGSGPDKSTRYSKQPGLPSPPPSPPSNTPMDLTSHSSSSAQHQHRLPPPLQRTTTSASPKSYDPKLLLMSSKPDYPVHPDYSTNDRIVSSSFGSPPSSCGSSNNHGMDGSSGERNVRKYQKRKPVDSHESPMPLSPGKKHHSVQNTSGVKPKQRRYRTERPFHCPHCPARFTLRSNMERHGKHQHASVWQRSPSNRVLNKQRALAAQQTGGSHAHRSRSPNETPPSSRESGVSLLQHANPNPNIRLVLSQQLKRKLSNLEQADLASVETLLEKTGNEDFKKYFRSVAGEYDEEDEDGEMNEEEDEEDQRGEEEGEEVMEEDAAIDEYDDERFKEDYYDEDEDESGVANTPTSKRSLRSNSKAKDTHSQQQKVQKSLSAYSSAPHKISCPHCTRKFPWTSSLRRHLLTHTGQKPFQCSQCPLLFTTKSNCDRHVARKHSNAVTITVSDSEPILRGKLSGGANSGGHSKARGAAKVDADEGGEDDEEEDEDEDDYDGLVSRSMNSGKSEGRGVSGGKKGTGQSEEGLDAGNGPAGQSAAGYASFRCHLCELSSPVRSTILKHMEEFHADNYALLDVVGSNNSAEDGEEEREEVRGGNATNRKVLCAFCIRRFWSVEDLRRHMRSHTGERPFSCEFCSRRFTLKHSMLRHLKKHGENNDEQRGNDGGSAASEEQN